MSLDSLPKEEISQETGKLAGRSLAANLPINWTETSLDGDADFGIDYLVQVKNSSNQIIFSFFLQLKGTKSPKLIKDKNTLAFEFDVSTLNFYRKTEPAVMVALVDLSTDQSPKNCITYYKWLDEDFLDSIKDKREKNKEKVTIHISKGNILNEKLDIESYYLKRLDIRDNLQNLHSAIESHSDDPLSDISAFIDTIKKRPVIIDAVKEDSGAPWINNPESHNSGKLKSIFDHIKSNQIITASEKISEIEDSTDLTDHEYAELHNLKAYIYLLNEKDKDAFKHYEIAYKKHSTDKYKIKYLESFLRRDGETPKKDLEFIVKELKNNKNFDECFLKAKCLVLQGKKGEAYEVLRENHPEKLVATLLLSILSKDKVVFSEAIRSIDIQELDKHEQYNYYLFLARHQFYDATNYSDETEFPATGKNQYNFDLLKECHKNILKTWIIAETLGYPSSIFLLIDISKVVFSLFEDSKTIIKYIEKLRKQRPENQSYINDLIALKYNYKKYDHVVKLIDELKYKSPDTICLLILSLYYLGKKSMALQEIEVNKELLLVERPDNFEEIFCIAAQCSMDTLDENKEKEYLDIIKSLEKGKQLVAVYHYIHEMNKNLGRNYRKELNKKLYEKYLKTGKPKIIARQIFNNLSSQDTNESTWICELAKQLGKHSELTLEQNIHYADALVTCKKWNILESLANKVTDRGNTSNIWMLIKAAALEEQGKSEEALKALDSSLDKEERSLERAERYVSICMRLGLFEKAEEKLQALLETSPPDKHFSIVESLIFIYSSGAENNSKLLSAINRYGEMADQEDEQQEGQFLLFFLILTNRQDLDISHYLHDFRRRSDNYTNKFPNSKLLRQGRVNVDAPKEEFLKSINELAGITEEQENQWNKNRNQIRNRKLPIPFALLHHFLNDTNDIFSTWVMSKFTHEDKSEYKLRHSTKNRENVSTLINETNRVLLDETTLLLLNEIGLLEKICQSINIVINKNVYEKFSRSSHISLGSIYSAIPRSIIKIIGANLKKVQFIGEIKPDESLLGQYKNILGDHTDLIVCSDDLVFSEVFKTECENNNFINTLNIIDYLVERGIIDESLKLKYLEKICNLGIENTLITHDDLLKSLQLNINELGNESSISNSNFMYVFNRVFILGGNFVNAFENFTHFNANYLNKSLKSNNSINKDVLIELINIFIIRFPKLTKKQMLASLYIWIGVRVKIIKEHEFIPRSSAHYLLWEIVKEIWVKDNNNNLEISLSEMCNEISILVLYTEDLDASNIYNVLIQAFIPDTEEYDLFKITYTRNSIEKRMKESIK